MTFYDPYQRLVRPSVRPSARQSAGRSVGGGVTAFASLLLLFVLLNPPLGSNHGIVIYSLVPFFSSPPSCDHFQNLQPWLPSGALKTFLDLSPVITDYKAFCPWPDLAQSQLGTGAQWSFSRNCARPIYY